MRTVLSASVVMLIAVAASTPAAQRAPFPLTEKLTSLDGTWVHDPARGTGGICGVPKADVVTVKVSPSEIAIDASDTQGVIRLDGTQTVLGDGRTATAALDAGWLAVTMRRARNGGATNVMRDVYIALGRDLTIWRTLNVELPDGTQGKIDCGNHWAIVYTRK